jgi:hypothetical protein
LRLQTSVISCFIYARNFVALLLKKGGNYLMKPIQIISVHPIVMGTDYLCLPTNFWLSHR